MRSHALGEHRGRVRGSFGGSRGGCFVSPRVFRSRGNPCGVALKPLERFVSGAFCVSVPHYVPRFQNTPTQAHITNKQGEAPKPEASTIFGSNVEKPA